MIAGGPPATRGMGGAAHSTNASGSGRWDVDICRPAGRTGGHVPDGLGATRSSQFRSRFKGAEQMIPADVIQTALSLIPAALLVAILVIAAVIAASVSTAEPGGLVRRTMDPAASWR
jgi:hypothetical protein